MKMYVWTDSFSFLAVAHAPSVNEARRMVLDTTDLGRSGDGSCPEHDRARSIVTTAMPNIWMGLNAEFALRDSAEVRMQELRTETLRKRIAELEAELAVARVAAGQQL